MSQLVLITWLAGYCGCSTEAAYYLVNYAQEKAERTGEPIPGTVQGVLEFVDMPQHIRREPYAGPMTVEAVKHMQEITRRGRALLDGGGVA